MRRLPRGRMPGGKRRHVLSTGRLSPGACADLRPRDQSMTTSNRPAMVVVVLEQLARANGRKLEDLVLLREPWVKDGTITGLYLGATGLTNLTPLSGLPALKELDLCGTGPVDLTPLASLTSLE